MRRVGWPLIVTGLALAAWATREAGEIDLERPDRVATSGPYSFSRHPMYVAWTLAFVGVGLVINTAWLMILLPPLAALIDREVRTEEDRLTAAFGVEYQAYQAQVRRYL
jgi:protein-S-isoprenylcysteine O-methyltransferase Ste14